MQFKEATFLFYQKTFKKEQVRLSNKTYLFHK